MIKNTQIGEIILVLVDGSDRPNYSTYRSSETIGDYETYIVKDLVSYVDANYRTIPHLQCRGIAQKLIGITICLRGVNR
jgi:hypothetical protein